MIIISCRPLQYSGSTPDCGFGNPGSTPGKGIHFYTTNNVKERKKKKEKRNYLNIEKDRKKERGKRKGKANLFKLSCFYILEYIITYIS